MQWIKELRAQPWWIITASITGLFVLIAGAGLAGLALNQRVSNVTQRALEYDVRLEDIGDDLRAAVLDMRHYQRNLVFSGPSRYGVADFEQAYVQLHAEIDELEQLGVQDPRMLPAAQIRTMSEAYYATFRPAIDVYRTDQPAFTRASDDALMQLAALQQAATDIDKLGEQRAATMLQSVRQATTSARWVLLAVLGGLGLIGVGLGMLVLRVVRAQHATADKLAQALQAKTDFIADASHELRTPLTVLRGNAEVALELDRTGVHVEFLEEIVRESERMTQMIEDLLFLARSDAGSLPLHLETVAVVPFFTELAGRAEVLVRERGASLRTQLNSDADMQIDSARIAQAVLILVDNAAKYSPAGQPVTLMVHEVHHELVIEVWDRGPGIAAADLPFVFERFYRVDKARARKLGGAGLGLAIAKTLVQAHGGRIEAESHINVGTQMKIFLPGGAPARRALHAVKHAAIGRSL